LRQRGAFYRRWRAAGFIGSVGETAEDRALPSAPPSCFLSEEEDGEGVRWAGWCWAAPAGLCPGKFSPLFFLFNSFLLFLVFCLAISNTSLPFYFAGFELAIHLQYLEFEIS
jgi:hypothetical protein